MRHPGHVKIRSRASVTPPKLLPVRLQCQSVAYASERWAFTNGEIVAHDVYGRPSFNVLQNNRSAGSELHIYAFDLLTLRGKDLTRASLEKRRELLRAKVMSRLHSLFRHAGSITGQSHRGGSRVGFRGL